MIRRIWLFLRDLVWTAVGSLALIIVTLALALAGSDWGLVVGAGLSAVSLAILATRS